jgi:hypothetical protein
MPVCEIAILFHECVNEPCPLDGPLVSNASWVKKELGDKWFSCPIVLKSFVVNRMCHDGWVWGQNITYK